MTRFKRLYFKTVILAVITTSGCLAFSTVADNQKPSNAETGNAVADAAESNKPLTVNFFSAATTRATSA